MSVTLSEWMNSPCSELPEWETRSVWVKPGVFDIPRVGFDGNVVLEQGVRFGAPVEAFFQLALFGLESPVDGSGLIERSCFWTDCEIAKRLMAQGSHNGRRALSRAEHG